jgi:hypothetical protein
MKGKLLKTILKNYDATREKTLWCRMGYDSSNPISKLKEIALNSHDEQDLDEGVLAECLGTRPVLDSMKFSELSATRKTLEYVASHLETDAHSDAMKNSLEIAGLFSCLDGVDQLKMLEKKINSTLGQDVSFKANFKEKSEAVKCLEISITGDTDTAKKILALLSKAGIKFNFLQKYEHTETGLKIIEEKDAIKYKVPAHARKVDEDTGTIQFVTDDMSDCVLTAFSVDDSVLERMATELNPPAAPSSAFQIGG